MIRLIFKEMLAARWIIGLAGAASVLMVLFGDPLFYRGESMSGWSGWLILPFVLLGLGAYSSEFAKGTIPFLYSRPIKWWQIWLSKLISGLLAAIMVAIVSAVAYVLVVPEIYKPFLWSGILDGLPLAVGTMAIAYGIGFAVSVLMPGIVLSIGSLIVVMLSLAVIANMIVKIGSLMGWIVQPSTSNALENNVLSLMILTGAVGTALVAQKLPKLSTGSRWLRWSMVAALCLPFAVLFTVIGVRLNYDMTSPAISSGIRAYDVSPDGRWAVYGTSKSHRSPERLVLVNTATGESLHIADEPSVSIVSWSPDSEEFVYISTDRSLKIVRLADNLEPRQVTQVGFDPTDEPSWAMSSTEILWDPEGGRIAVKFSPTYHSTYRPWLASVDITSGKVEVAENPDKVYKINDALTMPSRRPLYLYQHGLMWSQTWKSLPDVQDLKPLYEPRPMPLPVSVPGAG